MSPRANHSLSFVARSRSDTNASRLAVLGEIKAMRSVKLDITPSEDESKRNGNQEQDVAPNPDDFFAPRIFKMPQLYSHKKQAQRRVASAPVMRKSSPTSNDYAPSSNSSEADADRPTTPTFKATLPNTSLKTRPTTGSMMMPRLKTMLALESKDLQRRHTLADVVKNAVVSLSNDDHTHRIRNIWQNSKSTDVGTEAALNFYQMYKTAKRKGY